MAVVKADAYGHGAVEVAKTALACGADYLAVARLEEGVALRQQGIQAPMLVFVTFFEEQARDFLEFSLDATVFDLPRAQALNRDAKKAGKRARVHIKVDTGMGRLGIDWRQAGDFVKNISHLKHLDIVGIYTHFATSDVVNKEFAMTQLRRFHQVLDGLHQAGISVPLKHAANSGAILDIPESYLDMVRAGVSMYGYYPSGETSESIALAPAMTLKSRIVAIKALEKGGYVSYGLTYQTQQPTRIAIIPVGYGDGYNRALSNRCDVLLRGRRYPVVGRVCMDVTMVDVGLTNDVQVGDEVVLMGRQGEEEISIFELCEKLDTIPYEITCWISKRVPRRYLEDSGLSQSQM